MTLGVRIGIRLSPAVVLLVAALAAAEESPRYCGRNAQGASWVADCSEAGSSTEMVTFLDFLGKGKRTWHYNLCLAKSTWPLEVSEEITAQALDVSSGELGRWSRKSGHKGWGARLNSRTETFYRFPAVWMLFVECGQRCSDGAAMGSVRRDLRKVVGDLRTKKNAAQPPDPNCPEVCSIKEWYDCDRTDELKTEIKWFCGTYEDPAACVDAFCSAVKDLHDAYSPCRE